MKEKIVENPKKLTDLESETFAWFCQIRADIIPLSASCSKGKPIKCLSRRKLSQQMVQPPKLSI